MTEDNKNSKKDIVVGNVSLSRTFVRDAFIRYVNVQNSGVVNMLSKDVQTLAQINEDMHMFIIENYEELLSKCPSNVEPGVDGMILEIKG